MEELIAAAAERKSARTAKWKRECVCYSEIVGTKSERTVWTGGDSSREGGRVENVGGAGWALEVESMSGRKGPECLEGTGGISS